MLVFWLGSYEHGSRRMRSNNALKRLTVHQPQWMQSLLATLPPLPSASRAARSREAGANERSAAGVQLEALVACEVAGR
eukprot:7152962-Alexandrium_andersonii.AAC.1